MTLQEYTLEDIIFEPPHVDIVLQNKERRFWVRPPTPIEKDMCQAVARSRSRELRKILNNPKTEEHKLLIKSQVDDLTDEDLQLLWVAANLYQKIFEINRISLDNREEYFVPEPKGKEDGVIPPTAEEMEQYEEAKEKAEQQRQDDVAAAQEQARKSLENEAKAKPKKELRDSVIATLVEQKCQEEWNAQYGLQLIFRCTYLDKDLGQRAFKTEGYLRRMAVSPDGERLIERLRNEHMGLMLNPDLLKT